MKYHKLVNVVLSLLLALSVISPTANAKQRHKHVHHYHTVKINKIKYNKRTPAKRHISRTKKFYKEANHDVVYPPTTNHQLSKVKNLLRNHTFRNGIKHYICHYVSTWDYSKRGVQKHSNKFLKNYYSYIYGIHNYRMGFLAGTNLDDGLSTENQIDKAKHNRSFWKGFHAGLYNSYGYRANYKTARLEFLQDDKLLDDVAPPYSR